MRKVTILSALLLLLILQSGGMLTWYQWQRIIHKYQTLTTNTQRQEKQQTMLLTVSEYQQYKAGNDEICINHKMYDVKSISFSNGQVQLQVVADVAEDNINKHIQLAASGTDNPNSLPDAVLDLLTATYIIPSSLHIQFRPLASLPEYYVTDIAIASAIGNVSAPPPWLV